MLIMKKSQVFMLIGALLPLLLFVLPIWRITLEAPQYPIPLGMSIYVNDFADLHPHDIKNINLMNHYVGMKYIPESIPEFKIFPWVIIGMSILGVLFAFLKKPNLFLVWFVVFAIFGVIGMYDFYLWEYNYGHELDPKAIMKFTNPDGTIMGFQPPVFGSKDILNFKAHSYPQWGALMLALGMLSAFIAYILGRKEKKNEV